MSELTTLFNNTNVQAKFEKLLGEKAQGFISSVLQTVNSNTLLQKADPNTVLTAAATAASLDLPINQSLGFAWIVPYKGKAQFQMGWKGFVQLALRTGQYRAINVIEVYENQFISFNTLTEDLNADFSKEGKGSVVGYAAYLSLVNGFQKTTYWSKEKVTAHAKKYSQAYGTQYSPWSSADTFDAMAKKTVLKNTLNKWGIMSIEMQTATITDQAVIQGDNTVYIDNGRQTIDIEANNAQTEQERINNFVSKCTNLKSLQELEDTLIMEDALTDEAQNSINIKRQALAEKLQEPAKVSK